jgi:long-chain fatty acid transport protein
MKSAHWFLLACILVTSTPARSPALGIRIPDQDARATARGNAFTATADNPSAIYYNPAGISFLYTPSLNAPKLSLGAGGGKSSVPPADSQSAGTDSGVLVRLGLYAITLGDEVNLSANRGALDISHRWQPAPNFYATWKKQDLPLTFGLGIYAPYGFGVWYPENSPLRTAAISGNISYMSINPVVSWQVTDTLSFAVGPTINYARTGLKRGIAPPGVLGSLDQLQFEGDGWAMGLNAGIMWRPHPKHSFGVTYRSQTDVNFEGSLSTFIPGLLNTRLDASAGIKFPQHVIFGYSFRPTPRWNLEFNLDWTDWDNLNIVNVTSVAGPLPLPFNWQSSLFYEFGASYEFDHGITASIGYIFSENSVPDTFFNPVVPDSDRHIFSVGVGKRWKNWDFDLAYQWAHGPTRTINQGPFSVANGTYQFDSHAVSLSATYRF